MCRSRYFDEYLHEKLVDGTVKCFVYLGAGEESIPAGVAQAFIDMKIRPNVFAQHRNHGILCSFGADMKTVKDELLGLTTGTTGGIGGDPCHHAPNASHGCILGHSGLIADQIPIAIGVAFGSRQWSVCFLGDSSVEEDVWGPSLGFAVTHNVPVLFIECDDGLSVITEVSKRRSWDSVEIARAYGLECDAEESDDPFVILKAVRYLTEDTGPKYLRVKTCRKYRHVGPGTDGPMKWDRMAMVRERMGEAGIEIEQAAKREMAELWAIG